jgi:hypothetical protein
MQQRLKKWLDNDAKIKEMLMAQKIEMDREQLIRIQNMYIESQKLVTERKETAQIIKNQELQQSKSDHDKVCNTSEQRCPILTISNNIIKLGVSCVDLAYALAPAILHSKYLGGLRRGFDGFPTLLFTLM